MSRRTVDRVRNSTGNNLPLERTGPRCAICAGEFVGDIPEVIEFARVGDIDMPGFDPADLVCAMCWFEAWGDEGVGTA